MKDLPHHLKKLNRQVIRSIHREELQAGFEMPDLPPHKQTERQVKKQAKAKLRKERNERTPTPLTPEEREKKMGKRVPVFDRNNATPKRTRASKKKTPRI